MKNLIAVAVIAAFSGMAFAAEPVVQNTQPAGVSAPVAEKNTNQAPDATVEKMAKKKKKKKK